MSGTAPPTPSLHPLLQLSAPVAVALAAGLHATRLDGSPLTYNHPDPYLPDLLICHPLLAKRALEAVADFEAPPPPPNVTRARRGGP